MKLTDEERKQIVTYRLNKAKETLQEAKGNIQMEYWNTAANRLYYACYYAVSALLIKHEYITRTHSGVISLLGEHFIQKGIINQEQGAFYGRLFDFRQKSDYNDLIIIQPEKVKQMMVPSEEFVATLEKLILE